MEWLKQEWYFIGFAVLAFLIASCTKINDTYHDFWKNGENIYPASPDSIRVHSGKERIKVSWLTIGDPSISKAKIYWNNKTDSLVVPIKRDGKSSVDTIHVMLENLPEGFYAFDIYTYDDQGHQSVVANVVGHSYGQSYSNSLLSRLVSNAFYINDTTTIVWGSPADATSIGVELEYKDTTGATRQLSIGPDADSTFISDFAFTSGSSVSYRTLYLPDSTSIDTFYTKYETVQVLGPRIELPKTGWSATASSYDQRHGDDRKPFSAIDGNEGSMWVNQISPQLDYPHSLTIDMGAVQDNIYGVSLSSNGGGETPSNASIYISDDGTTWQLMGLFSIEKVKGTQYLDFSAPQSFRYAKAEFGSSYGSKNIIIYEMGVFTR